MKATLLLIGLLLSGSAFAQNDTQPLIIGQDVLANSLSEQQAPNVLLAYNQIHPQAKAHYQAGQSITLQPGFDAQLGSVFVATIGRGSPVNGEPTFWIRAYPNPFVEQTRIEYNLPLGGLVRQALLDLNGQLVRSSQELTEQSAGIYQQQVNTADLPAGVYLYQVQTGNKTSTIRLVKKP